MADEIVERVKLVADYIIECKATVRDTANYVSTILGKPVSKTTIDKDINERLIKLNPSLYSEVKKILMENQANRTENSTKTWQEKSYNYAVENDVKVLEIAKYMIETNSSIDETSKYFLSVKGNMEGYSSKTIYKDIVYRLPLIDPDLASQISEVLKTRNTTNTKKDKTI